MPGSSRDVPLDRVIDYAALSDTTIERISAIQIIGLLIQRDWEGTIATAHP